MATRKPIRVIGKPGVRHGFSLVELLIASTLGLMIMASLATLFGVFSRTLSQSRDVGDLSGQIRGAAWKLRQDLENVTVPVAPWARPEANAGYFELIEGPFRDTDAANLTSNLRADVDDVMLFTTRSPGRPFIGSLDSLAQIESPYAEVAWFCKPSTTMIGTQPLYVLYRRQLLVLGYVGAAAFATTNSVPFTNWPAFYARTDLSCRRDGSSLFPNDLGDLTKRENRFLHNLSGIISSGSFPYPFPRETIFASSTNTLGEILDGNREGEDVVLRNVLSFDVRAFDSATSGASQYVDLGSSQGVGPLSGAVNAKAQLTVPTYDTWSMHYEFNGIDEDGVLGIDQGTDGVDSGGGSTQNGIVDDEPELETAPPYAVQLRGVEIRIRCIEPVSREIRQVTIRHSFVKH